MSTKTSFKIFEPIEGKDMKSCYPELAEIEEFNGMSDPDLRFIWWFSCQSSPILGMPESDRLLESIKRSYGETSKKPIVQLLQNGEVPDSFSIAIARMRSFVPDYRLRAKYMAYKMFANTEQMIEAGEFEGVERIKHMDFEERKKFIDMMSVATKMLPELIQQVERGFGVSKKKGSSGEDDDEDGNLMDHVMERSSH